MKLQQSKLKKGAYRWKYVEMLQIFNLPLLSRVPVLYLRCQAKQNYFGTMYYETLKTLKYFAWVFKVILYVTTVTSLTCKLQYKIATIEETENVLCLSYIHRFHHFPLSDGQLLISFCVFAIGGPFLFLVVALATHHTPSANIIKPNFGVSSCWFDGELIT